MMLRKRAPSAMDVNHSVVRKNTRARSQGMRMRLRGHWRRPEDLWGRWLYNLDTGAM